MREKIAQLRQDYQNPPLHIEELAADPLQEFRTWFSLALTREPFEANAMTLATVDQNGQPTARVVLLKELDARGFVFYSNYNSQKGLELELQPCASLLFYWAAQHRQVRIKGRVEKTSSEESDTYFDSRPRGAQLGAWASLQSQLLESRQELEQRLSQLQARFKNSVIPRPPHWGGYRLLPVEIEFWQGQPSRLHDRVLYKLGSEGWSRWRLMP